MKILLTGGTGYIGSHTAVELVAAGYKEIVIFDNLSNSKELVMAKIAEISGIEPEFVEGDILDKVALKGLFKKHKFDAVMHFAGLKAVGESVEKPLQYYETNVGGTVNLLEAMRVAGCKKIIFSSSATVYGEHAEVPYSEDAPTGQGITNPYGETKHVIEEILKDVAESESGWQVVILRYFNPVGNHPSGLIGEDPNGIPNNLMPIVMKVARGEMAELLIFGDDYDTPDGSGVRDFIHVVDLAKGHVAALEKLSGLAADDSAILIYNLGTGGGRSVFEVIATYEKHAGKKLPRRVVDRRLGDIGEVYAGVEKAARELGWKTELDLDDAMRDTLKFLG
ncbi:UDP-glucose 4-epimerase GalE [Candidatus Saccharibacteria bacterium]|nr:UDP-glucose 4-epimerase GalE [Candidatus Saccharibacteria bacterium]